MKITFLLISLLLITNTIYSQSLTPEQIIGKWKVVKILKKPSNPNFKDFLKGFESATFEFKSDSKFNLTTNNNNKIFSMLTDHTQNVDWIIRKNIPVISIGSKTDHYNTLNIYAKLGETNIFQLEESEIVLQVEKL
ncbi:hypothetical protein [Rhizosphaericola mali]|uniref:Lipocalin-like domain-containing protein n=1 Tax=Rhizosphaericola mali TaxID=2545455 RepID=A0A5P2G4N3_9BACT|nr:hypothetical protein [Rhizosphaericola mali]QES89648.1 hypothetical protein E0W69_013585 [Rhizosphaericola mali]